MPVKPLTPNLQFAGGLVQFPSGLLTGTPPTPPATPSVPGTINLYFNDTASGGGNDGDWANVLNWWSDDLWTVPAGAIPTATQNAELNSAVTTISTGTATAKNLILGSGGDLQNSVAVTVIETLFAIDHNLTSATVTGNAVFNGRNNSTGGSVTGTSWFINGATNNGTTGFAVFKDTSINGGSGTVATGWFFDSSVNNGSVDVLVLADSTSSTNSSGGNTSAALYGSSFIASSSVPAGIVTFYSAQSIINTLTHYSFTPDSIVIG